MKRVLGWAVMLALVGAVLGTACGGKAPATVDGSGSDGGDDRAPADTDGAPADIGAPTGDGGGGRDAEDAAPADDAAAPGGDTAGDPPARPDSLGFDGTILSEETACHDLANTAPIIAPRILDADAGQPSLQGGVLADGRYELVAADYYRTGPTPARPLYRRTIELRQQGTRMLMVDLAPYNPTNPNNGLWITVRPAYTLASAASGMLEATPDPCGTATATSYRYESAGDVLRLWNESAGTLHQYLRAP